MESNQEGMPLNRLISILRNPYEASPVDLRQAQLEAANRLEMLKHETVLAAARSALKAPATIVSSKMAEPVDDEYPPLKNASHRLGSSAKPEHWWDGSLMRRWDGRRWCIVEDGDDE